MISKRLLKKVAKYLIFFAIFVIFRTSIFYLVYNPTTPDGELSSRVTLPSKYLLKHGFDPFKDPHEKSPDKNLADIRKDFYKDKLKNVPIDLVYNWNQRDRARVDGMKCKVQLPRLDDLKISNDMYQYFEHVKTSSRFWFFNAYIDDRPLNIAKRVIRLIFQLSGKFWYRTEDKMPLYCYSWYIRPNELYPVLEVSQATSMKRLYPPHNSMKQIGNFVSVVATCPLNEETQDVPVAVSISEELCPFKLYNAISLNNQYSGSGGEIGLCLKGLYHTSSDDSYKLIEWLEIQKAIKVDKVFAYVIDIHDNMMAVLDFYSKQDFVEILPLRIPGEHIGLHMWTEDYFRHAVTTRRGVEMLAQMDCFYRIRHKFRYVAICDSDEVYLPRNDPDLPSLLTRTEKMSQVNVSSFYFQSYFFPELHQDHLIPKTSYNGIEFPNSLLYAMKYIYRVKSKKLGKSIHTSKYTEYVTTHRQLGQLGSEFRVKRHWFQFADAYEGHYRGSNWTGSPFHEESLGDDDLDDDQDDQDEDGNDFEPKRNGVGDMSPYETLIKDSLIWRWRSQVLNGVITTWSQLNISRPAA